MFRRLNILAVLAMFMGGTLFAQRPDVVADHYYIGFRGPISANERALVAAQVAAVSSAFPEVNALEIIVRNPAQLNALQRNPNVDYVEQVPMRYAVGLADSQLTPSLNNGLYGLITTKAVNAHSRNVTGFAVNVGVADTGIDYQHPDIFQNYRGGIDTVGAGDNDPFWDFDPNETHGTHVAGTIVARNDNIGVLGTAYSANLFHARVLGPTGGSATDVMEGVRWLVETAKW
jgi:subtilisin